MQQNSPFLSDHAHSRMPAHRHKRGYAALILKGGYTERSPDGVWRCEPGDMIVHPRFHVHGNDVAKTGAHVLNIPLPHCAETATYRVVSVRPERLLCSPSLERLIEALNEGDAKPAEAAGDWRDAFAQALAANPLQSVSDLARQFGVSAEHASRAFRDWFAMTPIAFRSEHRLRAALEAIEAGASIADSAHASGYADQSHMTRSFASALGMTPKRVRTLN